METRATRPAPVLAGSPALASIRAIAAGLVLITGFAVGVDALLGVMLPAVFTPGRGPAPAAGLLVTLAYVPVFVVAGCYVTACLAPERPMLHALALGVVGLAVNAVAVLLSLHAAPAWFHAASLLLVMPCAWFGGRLREHEIAYRAGRDSTILSG